MSSNTVLFDGSGSSPTAGRPFSLVPVGSASVRTVSDVVSASVRSFSRFWTKISTRFGSSALPASCRSSPTAPSSLIALWYGRSDVSASK